MTATATAFLSLLLWFTLLLVFIAILRSGVALAGKHAPNQFDPGGADVSDFSRRLCRAHANFYESFPLLGGALLYALASDLTHLTDPLAYVVVVARVAQSLVHLASTSVPAVFLRFGLFLVQVSIVVWWLVLFLRPALAGA